jgi:hypothetical protein
MITKLFCRGIILPFEVFAFSAKIEFVKDYCLVPCFDRLLAIELIQQFQQLSIARNVAHRMAIMRKPYPSLFVDDDLRRHAAELEQVDFLPIELEHAMLGVGQTDEWQFMIGPIILKEMLAFWANHDDLRVALNKLLVISAQLRHVLFAERSEEAAIEDQYNVFLAAKIGKPHGFIVEIIQREIRRRRVKLNFGQTFLLPKAKVRFIKTIVAFLKNFY